MTPLAQSNLEHGQENISSDLEHVSTPVDHVDPNGYTAREYGTSHSHFI